MKSFTRILTTLIAGGLLATAGTAEANDFDKLSKRLQELQAKYVTTMGLYDQLRADVEDLAKLPNASAIKGLTGDQFKSALQACWDSPIEQVKDVQREAIDAGRAAASLKERSAMRGVKDTEIELKNARASVTSCKDKAIAASQLSPDALNDAGKEALETKLATIDQIRVLSKHELPTRSKKIVEDATKLQAEALAAIKTAEVKAQAAAKNPFGGGGKKEKQEVEKIKSVQAEAEAFQKLVTQETTEIPAELTKTGTQMGKNITDLSALLK